MIGFYALRHSFAPSYLCPYLVINGSCQKHMVIARLSIGNQIYCLAFVIIPEQMRYINMSKNESTKFTYCLHL